MCGPTAGPDFIVAWPTAEVGFLEPEIAVDVVYGSKAESEKAALIEKMVAEGNPWPLAEQFYIHDVIDPRDTRNYLISVLSLIKKSKTGGKGRHLLANWPSRF